MAHEPPEVIINLAGVEHILSEFNTWVCIFTDVPAYDHVYITKPVMAIFECRKLIDQLMHLGFPMQIRRLPTPWDLSAYDQYIANQVQNLDHEIAQLGVTDED